MSHAHHHGHHHHGSRRRLALVLALTCAFLAVEVVAGLLTGSLSLLADAGHMLTDVAGLVLALAAMKFAERRPSPRRTYGYHRVEILAALTNALVLAAVAGYILAEAWERFRSPQPVASVPVLAVAAVGLLVNLVGALLLRAGLAGEPQRARGLQRGPGRRPLVGRRDRRGGGDHGHRLALGRPLVAVAIALFVAAPDLGAAAGGRPRPARGDAARGRPRRAAGGDGGRARASRPCTTSTSGR